ncbi:hypothetical protein P9H08_14495 [Bacillus cereus]|nr:hypothetical protein [Bacillus cereus]MED3312904.1 hypothetical protein [Bacillus thuringiensis]
MVMDLLRSLLNRDEPDYTKAAKLGAEAIPYLLELVKGAEPRLAPRAVYTASLINNEQAVNVLEEGMKSLIPQIRVAAAAAVRHQPNHVGNKFIPPLLEDNDIGVVKVTLQSMRLSKNKEMKSEVEKLAQKIGDQVDATPEGAKSNEYILNLTKIVLEDV